MSHHPPEVDAPLTPTDPDSLRSRWRTFAEEQRAELGAQLGRPPSQERLASRVGLSRDSLRRLLGLRTDRPVSGPTLRIAQPAVVLPVPKGMGRTAEGNPIWFTHVSDPPRMTASVMRGLVRPPEARGFWLVYKSGPFDHWGMSERQSLASTTPYDFHVGAGRDPSNVARVIWDTSGM